MSSVSLQFLCAALCVTAVFAADERIPGARTVAASFHAGGSISDPRTGLFTAAAGLSYNHNRLWVDEWDLGFNWNITQEKGTVLQRDGAAHLRYGCSITRALYHFYRADALHSRALEIEYHLAPALGLGYWFADIPGTARAKVEAGIGYSYRTYRDSSEIEGLTAHLREMAEFHFSKSLTLGESAVVEPVFASDISYLFTGTAFIRFSVDTHLSVRLDLGYRYDAAAEKDSADIFVLAWKLEYLMKKTSAPGDGFDEPAADESAE